MKNPPLLTTVICFLVATNLLTIFLAVKPNPKNPYQWLNPELSETSKPVINKTSYLNFKLNLEKTIKQMERDGRLERIAVFYRDLVNGPTFSINPNKGFIPSSLLKLPLAITYLDLADENKIFLENKLVVENLSFNLIQQFPPPEEIINGSPYSIQELIQRLIAYSDNKAWQVLYNYLSQISPDRNLLFETFKSLGIIDIINSDDISDEDLSVKSYASIFRLLYNASYLSEESSNLLLDYLSKSTFDEGIKKGVPDNTAVAHKFGERFIDGKKQLHDCGIIYYPDNPYLLCVMTKGRDFNELADIIAAISKSVYEEVDSRRL